MQGSQEDLLVVQIQVIYFFLLEFDAFECWNSIRYCTIEMVSATMQVKDPGTTPKCSLWNKAPTHVVWIWATTRHILVARVGVSGSSIDFKAPRNALSWSTPLFHPAPAPFMAMSLWTALPGNYQQLRASLVISGLVLHVHACKAQV